MPRYTEIEFKILKKSNKKDLTKNKRRFCETWLEKVVLKDSEYEEDESCLFSNRRNKSYVLLSVVTAKWVSIAKKIKALADQLFNNIKSYQWKVVGDTLLHRSFRDAIFARMSSILTENITECSGWRLYPVKFPMQGIKLKDKSVGTFQREKSVDNLVSEI